MSILSEVSGSADRGGGVVGYGRAHRFEAAPDAPPSTTPDGFYLVGLGISDGYRREGLGLAITKVRLRWIADRALKAWSLGGCHASAIPWWAMTTKERLHEIVDQLSEPEADDALRVLEAHRAGEWWAHEPQRIVLNSDEAERFVHALEHPGAAHAGLRKLVARADAHDRG